MIGQFQTCPPPERIFLPSGSDRKDFRTNTDTENVGDVIMQINEAMESGAVLNLDFHSVSVP
jgi:hypothetical protein